MLPVAVAAAVKATGGLFGVPIFKLLGVASNSAWIDALFAATLSTVQKIPFRENPVSGV